jgi:hypothetical protein
VDQLIGLSRVANGIAQSIARKPAAKPLSSLVETKRLDRRPEAGRQLHKLDRSLLGWSYDDRISPTDAVRLYRPVTIKSLHERGLLDANFSDARVHRAEFAGVQNFDGARHEHSPDVPKFQVWTSALGKQVLKDNGRLPNHIEPLYH